MRPEYEHNPVNDSVFFLLMVFYGKTFNVKLCTMCFILASSYCLYSVY